MMRMQDVFSYYENDLKNVEEYIKQELHSEAGLIPEIILHLIGSGGKRFRPLLLLASSGVCGYQGERRYPMSAMIEFIHTATLLHDDVIDRAQMRRGKVSANNIWGNAASVLVGDFLYSRSFQLMTDAGNLSIMKLLSTTTNTMAEGEVFQLMKCGDVAITEEEYLSIIEKKTSILIAAACAVGSILAGAMEVHIDALSRFGMMIGSAFQITDDTLDYVAREDEFGKSIGKDLEEGKITLPLIHVLEHCSPEERELIGRVVRETDTWEHAAADIMALIHRHDGVGYAMGKARSYVEEGKRSLTGLPLSDAKDALFAVADYVLERKM